MRGKALIAAVAACLTFASITAHAEVRPIIIDEDEGGSVAQFLMWYGRVRDSGVPVRIRGLCGSACTLGLSLPREQLCIEPTGSLGFHLFSAYGRPNVSITWAYMRRHYPAPLLAFLKGKPITPIMWYVSAAELVQMGALRACDEGPAEGE